MTPHLACSRTFTFGTRYSEHPFSTRPSRQEYPLRSAIRTCVWPFCLTKPVHNLSAKHCQRLALFLFVGVASPASSRSCMLAFFLLRLGFGGSTCRCPATFRASCICVPSLAAWAYGPIHEVRFPCGSGLLRDLHAFLPVLHKIRPTRGFRVECSGGTQIDLSARVVGSHPPVFHWLVVVVAVTV